MWNLASIGQVASEEKMFENVDDGWRTTNAYLSYHLTNEPECFAVATFIQIIQYHIF